MAESQSAATSKINLKEKNSLLADLDIDKDFLSSWKTDEGMDFDFGVPAKGKKKAFNFDKMDMDFTLDGDFDKLSSFKIHMSDLDISSPPKKAGKTNERSKEESTGGKNSATADTFNFQFDFNGFDTLSFESGPTKVDEKSNKSQDMEGTSIISGSKGSGANLAGDIDRMEEDIALNLPATGEVATSKIDTQIGNAEDLDARNEDGCSKSVTDDSCPPKPANFGDHAVIERLLASPETTVVANIQEMVHESQQPDQNISAESSTQEIVQAISGQPLADNASAENTALDFQEEVSAVSRKVSSSKSGEQNANTILIASSDSTNENSSLHDVISSPGKNGDRSKPRDDNAVLTRNIDSGESTHDDSQFEHTSITTGSKNLLHGAMANGRNQDSTAELLVASSNRGTTVAKLVPVKGREAGVIQSKFFKRPKETESQLQQASASEAKLLSIGSKRSSTIQQCPADEKRECDAKAIQSGSKLSYISRSQPRELTKVSLVQMGNAENAKSLHSIRESFSSDSIETGSKFLGTSRTRDQGLTKEELVVREGEKNVENCSALSSHVHPSSSNEQANKCTSQNCVSSRLPTTSARNTNVFVEKNRTSPIKAGRMIPELPGLKASRAVGANLKPLNSLVLKDIRSMRNSEQSLALQGNTGSKRADSANEKKQTPPPATLKRKAFEGSNREMVVLTPLKRLSPSPSENRNSRRSPVQVVDKQKSTVDMPRDVSNTETETSSAIENDSNVEKAEAYSKELEDICNTLKKKHEEAKEILVRAIVNNNNLLMLNHPIYQEKICMAQKFAASFMSKETPKHESDQLKVE